MIIVIEGPAQSGKSTMANALRNFAISNRRGALLVDDHADGDAIHHIEKIIVGEPLKPGTDADKIPWKNDPIVVLVNSGALRLAEFEALVPGFTKKLGPVNVVTIKKGE